MKQTLKHIYQTFYLTVAVSIVVLAVFFTLARAVTPLLNDHSETIERWASKLLEQPIKISELAITWHKFTPVLTGRQVVIFNDANTLPLFKVNELDISLDILGSLLSGHFKLGMLRIDGAELTIQQVKDGSIKINGVNRLMPGSLQTNAVTDTDRFIEWLFSEPKIILNNINLTWHTQNDRIIEFKELNLNIRNDDNKHKLTGEVVLAQAIPSTIQFIVEMAGSWQTKNKIKADCYINAQNVLLAQWFGEYNWKGYKVLEGSGDFQIWGKWQENSFNSVQSLFKLDTLKLITPQAKQPFVLTSIISNLYWTVNKNNTWLLDANFSQVNFERWRKLPGFKGLAGYIHMAPENGVIALNSKTTQIEFGPLFKAPLNLKELTGNLTWQNGADGWTIQATHVNANNLDVALIADFGLWLPANNSEPVISLLAKINTGVNGVKNLSYYLPLTLLKPDLIHWLNKSIVNVKEGVGTLALHGRLTDFPFDEGSGTFLVEADIKGGELDYWPGWPMLKQADAELVFLNRSMSINLRAGQILSIPLQNIQVSIPVLKKKIQTILNINGQVNADLAQGMQFLQRSPLRDKIGSSLQDIELKGPMQLQLKAAIPIEFGPAHLAVHGRVLTKNAELAIPERNLGLNNLTGTLDFTEREITAPALTAMLWDKPIYINLDSQPQIRLDLIYQAMPLTLWQSARGWLLKINNPNVSGTVLIPRYKSQALEATFDYLNFDPNTKSEFFNWRIDQIPALKFLANKLWFGAKQFNQVQFQLRPIASGIEIINLNAVTSGGGISANGIWTTQGTQLNGTITTPNIAVFLTSLGLPAGIAGAGKIEFKLKWPDAPYTPSFQWLNGNVVLSFKQGQIMNIGADAAAKMDFGRLLTSLSFQSLERRFTGHPEVGNQGFEFDDMAGNFVLKNGSAYTTNLLLDGPVAQINLSGRIGLVAQDYDLTLQVIPHVTASLPIVAGLAGGPIVGAVAWVANKVLGSEVQKIAARTYQVIGPWKQPIVKPM